MVLLFVIFFFLILRFTVTLFNFLSDPKLPHASKSYTDLVSILIPARNEQNNILSLLQAIHQQEYWHYEVIILDDQSTDNTYNICTSFCENHHQFNVIKGEELPAGWLGKNYACYQLAKYATGKYLLFLDADEIILPNLINNAVHRLKTQKLALLSLFANQLLLTIGEQLVVPLMHFLLLNLLPLRLIKLAKSPSFAAASGQFMLFDAAVYREKQWHQQVKSKIVEDVEIMKLIKTYGYSGEALLANGYIYCRMYKNYTEAILGFSKNLLAGFGNSISGMLLYLFLVVFGPLYVGLYADNELFFFAAGLILLTRIMISFMSGQSIWLNILLHPLQMLSLLFIALVSIQKRLTKSVTWKGRRLQI